jgi:hypothetical protein
MCGIDLPFALSGLVMCLRSGRKREQWDNLLQTIAEIEIARRPGRQEKRVVKHRPKSYKMMQTPRNPNRNRYAIAV